MLSAVVLEFQGNSVKLVAGRKHQQGRIDILKVIDVDVNSLENGEKRQTLDLEALVGPDIVSLNAVIPSGATLYRKITLPFNDPKKLEQVAPLQLQDVLPFDIDEFLLSAQATNSIKSDNGYTISCALTSDQKLSETLDAFEKLGVDPQSIFSQASAIAGLSNLINSNSPEYALLEVTETSASVIAFKDDNLVSAREFSASGDAKLLAADISASLDSFEREHGLTLNELYVITQSDTPLSLNLPTRSLHPLNISKHFSTSESGGDLPANINWAYGILARELHTNTNNTVGLVDFRQGKYAYKPFVQTLLSAFKEELFAIGLAAVCGLVWLSANYWGIEQSLHSVENKLSSLIKPALPGIVVPYGREVSFIEGKIIEIEEQLKSVGSFGALSPLEVLKAISETVTPAIDIQVDALTISQSRVTFRGSVPDNSTISTLSTALSSNEKQFCNVNVEPKGKAAGSSRINFSAEVEICG